jgi:hypothetical protein
LSALGLKVEATDINIRRSSFCIAESPPLNSKYFFLFVQALSSTSCDAIAPNVLSKTPLVRILNQWVPDASHHPDGYNIGINDGPAAGQTVPHLHMHLIPRFTGDVPDPRGGVRWVIAEKARYWSN